MINHTFPTIRNISDVLPYIEGYNWNEFKVITKDWYTVINYVVALEDTFPSIEVSGGSEKMRKERQKAAAMRRECRGLVFNSATGALLSRPYHKFFNVGEKPETHVNKINLSTPHVILEKLDGSMIRPIIVPGTRKSALLGDGQNSVDFRLGTKAGVTDVAMNAEVWVAQRPNYVNFIRTALVSGLTPIFEWCSRKNRIVVDYPKDRLVLTAIRHTEKGYYLPYEHMVQWVDAFANSIDLVKVLEFGYDRYDQTQSLVDTIRQWEGEEGVVIRADGGAMVKIKADAYLTLHRSKAALSNEKNVIEVVINDQVDDLIPILTEEDAKRFRDFQRAFWLGVDDVASDMVDVYLADGVGIKGQKEFALEFVSQQDRHWHPFMYGLRKGKNVKEMLVSSIKTALSSQTKVDKCRWMFGNLRWNL
jgi:RNA ligase